MVCGEAWALVFVKDPPGDAGVQPGLETIDQLRVAHKVGSALRALRRKGSAVKFDWYRFSCAPFQIFVTSAIEWEV